MIIIIVGLLHEIIEKNEQNLCKDNFLLEKLAG